MARVRLSEPCMWDGVRREIGDVIDVPERTAELNSNWMLPTNDDVTPIATEKKAAKDGKEK